MGRVDTTLWLCFLLHRPLAEIMYLVLKHPQGMGSAGDGPGHTGRTHAQGPGSASGASTPGAQEEAGGPLIAGPHWGGCLLQIQDIVRRRQLLTIFREGKDGQQDVDVAILQALLKGEGPA